MRPIILFQTNNIKETKEALKTASEKGIHSLSIFSCDGSFPEGSSNGTVPVFGAKIPVSFQDAHGTVLVFALDAFGRISVIRCLKNAAEGNGYLTLSRLNGIFQSEQAGKVWAFVGLSEDLFSGIEAEAGMKQAQALEMEQQAERIPEWKDQLMSMETETDSIRKQILSLEEGKKNARLRASKCFEKKEEMAEAADPADPETAEAIRKKIEEERKDSKKAEKELSTLIRKERKLKTRLEQMETEMTAAKDEINNAEKAVFSAQLLRSEASEPKTKERIRKAVKNIYDTFGGCVTVAALTNGTESSIILVQEAERLGIKRECLLISDFARLKESLSVSSEAFPDVQAFEPYGPAVPLWKEKNYGNCMEQLLKSLPAPECGIPFLYRMNNNGITTEKPETDDSVNQMEILCAEEMETQAVQSLIDAVTTNGNIYGKAVETKSGALFVTAGNQLRTDAFPFPFTEAAALGLPDDGRFIKIRIRKSKAVTTADMAVKKEEYMTGKILQFRKNYKDEKELCEAVAKAAPDSYYAAQIDGAEGRFAAVQAADKGAKLEKPDINKSGYGVMPDGSALRFGLSNIKGIGEKSEAILKERRENGGFINVLDFIKRCRPDAETLKLLFYSGAFDNFVKGRKAAAEDSVQAMRACRRWSEAANRKEKTEKRLLENDYRTVKERDLLRTRVRSDSAKMYDLEQKWKNWKPSNVPDPPGFKVNMERRLLGISISAGPLDGYEAAANGCSRISDLKPDTDAYVIGRVMEINPLRTQKGIRVRLGDGTGTEEVIICGTAYDNFVTDLRENDIVKAMVHVEPSTDDPFETIAFARWADRPEPSAKQVIIAAKDTEEFTKVIAPAVGRNVGVGYGRHVLLLTADGTLQPVDFYLRNITEIPGSIRYAEVRRRISEN